MRRSLGPFTALIGFGCLFTTWAITPAQVLGATPERDHTTTTSAATASLAGLIFETPQSLGAPVNTADAERCPELSSDGKTLYFGFSVGAAQYDMKVAYRDLLSEPFGSPTFIPNINTGASEYLPSLSSDGLELYFARWSSMWDVFVAKRGSIYEEFGAPIKLGSEINSSARELSPHISVDGLTLYYTKEQIPGTYSSSRLMSSTRATVADPWGTGVLEVGGINDALLQKAAIARDGLVAFLGSDRTGSLGGNDLWFSTRASTLDPWSTPIDLGATVNSTTEDLSPFYSANCSFGEFLGTGLP